MGIIRWAFWNIVYLFRATPETLGTYLSMRTRRSWPYRKFQASCRHNDDGKLWEICFTEESSYVHPGAELRVSLLIGQESRSVTGLKVWDSELRRVALLRAKQDSIGRLKLQAALWEHAEPTTEPTEEK